VDVFVHFTQFKLVA